MRAIFNLCVTYPSYRYHRWLNNYYSTLASQLDNSSLKNEKVIVFIHGRGGNPARFIPLMENLRSRISTEYHMRAIDMGDTAITTIDTDTARLQTELDQYPECDIILVGASKGGLVILNYAITIDDPRIRKLITIVTPVMGTETVALYPDNLLIQEFAPDSPIVNRIVSRLLSLKIPMYHIVDMWDHMILPVTAATYSGTPRERIYYDYWPYNHIGELYNVNTAEAVSQFINDNIS